MHKNKIAIKRARQGDMFLIRIYNTGSLQGMEVEVSKEHLKAIQAKITEYLILSRANMVQSDKLSEL